MRPYGAEVCGEVTNTKWPHGCKCGICLDNMTRDTRKADTRPNKKRARRLAREFIARSLEE